MSFKQKIPRDYTTNARFSAVKIRSVIFKTCTFYATSKVTMSGAIPPFPLHDFMVCMGATLGLQYVTSSISIIYNLGVPVYSNSVFSSSVLCSIFCVCLRRLHFILHKNLPKLINLRSFYNLDLNN